MIHDISILAIWDNSESCKQGIFGYMESNSRENIIAIVNSLAMISDPSKSSSDALL
jgi:hypothetical protein